MKSIRIGTRASQLALYQANLVAKAFEKEGYKVDLVHITTRGDADQRNFVQLLGDGYFTRKIEQALLKEEIDVAVHSAKDLPSLCHKNLPWLAFSHRETTKDILISKKNKEIKHIGSSSPRRKAQLLQLYPNAEISPIRGNVDTRIQKLRSEDFDAIVLAEAGVKRLDLLKKIEDEFSVLRLDTTTAPCQGIIAIQSHIHNYADIKKVANMELSKTAKQEKEILRFLGGGCRLALGCNWDEGKFEYYTQDESFQHSKQGYDFFQEIVSKVSKNNYSHKVMLTHSLGSHLRVGRLFAQKEIGVYSYPLVEIKTIFENADWEKDFSKYDYIFTSPNGVNLFFQEYISRQLSLDDIKSRKIYCIGKATKEELNKYELDCEDLPSEANAKTLAAMIPQSNTLFCGNPDGEFSKHYKKEVLPLYRSYAYGNIWKHPENEIESIVFCSPSAIRFAEESLGIDYLKSKQIFSFGPTTSQKLQELKIPYTENTEAGSWKSMVETIANHIKR